MTNIRPFQIVLLAIFGFLAIVALIFLSAYQSQKSEETKAYGESVIVWGTLSQDVFKDVFQDVAVNDPAFSVVEYYEVPEASFDEELVNAIAEGRSPDLIVLESNALVLHRAKLFPIPYETFSERQFQDTFVDGAELFARQEGVYGLPFAVDPMVMYWNRDLFAANGLAQPPANWESVVAQVVPRLTVRDTNRNVLQSGVSFGEYSNVAHAKAILVLLALQSGSRMVTEEGDTYQVQINTPIVEGSRAPLEAAVQFYTDFSNVNSPLYTWNRSLPTDTDAFIAGKLGLYFGLASELDDLQLKNPNLNFDMAAVPQGVSATALRTYGDFYAFAIPRASQNAQGAYAVARTLSSAAVSKQLASALGMASPRRDVLAEGEQDLYRQIIAESALIARSWLDPNPEASAAIFKQMVEDIASNRLRIAEAVGDALSRLTLAY